MDKRKIIFVSIIAIIIVLAIAGFFTLRFISETSTVASDENKNQTQEQQEQNLEYQGNVNAIGNTQSTSNQEIEHSQNMNRNEEEVPESDQTNEEEPQQPPAEDKNVYADDSLTLSRIDQEKMKNTARDFLNAFLTYDAASCASGAYVASWSSLIASNAAASSGSELIYQHSRNDWNAAVSTYPDFKSSVESIEPQSVYISHLANEDTIAVRCKAIVIHNQGEPGEMDWKCLVKDEISYAVYFDENGQVLDVKSQHGKTIEFIG